MDQPEPTPQGVDTNRPSAARVYDYVLGGAHHVAVDRQLADQIASMTPGIAETMRADRAFAGPPAPGGYLLLSHATYEDQPPELIGAFAGVGRRPA